jgi:nicotinate-nucleotide pyrophosphorylase (carboxylating)
MSLAAHDDVRELIELAKREDLGGGDLSAALIDHPTQRATFQLVARQNGVFAGAELAQAIIDSYNETIELAWSPGIEDGLRIDQAPTQLATIDGPVAIVLSAERVLLNFLQRLCGIATKTRQFVDAIDGTGAKIYDTRKTTPGWRRLEKYAVRCGGGNNHRQGLFDAVLIKDNHLHGVETQRLAPTVFEMLNRLGSCETQPDFVQVEADSLAQVAQLLKIVGIDAILLDNFSLDDMRQAVKQRDELNLRGKIELEASGGIDLDTVRAVAETRVDRISVGAITHSATALDIALDRVGC